MTRSGPGRKIVVFELKSLLESDRIWTGLENRCSVIQIVRAQGVRVVVGVNPGCNVLGDPGRESWDRVVSGRTKEKKKSPEWGGARYGRVPIAEGIPAVRKGESDC